MKIRSQKSIAKEIGITPEAIDYHVRMKRLPKPTRIHCCPSKLYTKQQADEIIGYFAKGHNLKLKRESVKA